MRWGSRASITSGCQTAVVYEAPGFSPDTLAKLKAMGHENLAPFTYGRGIGDANSALRGADGF